ncbi:MAG: YkvA family protein, partial [Pirellulaceae bacterium]
MRIGWMKSRDLEKRAWRMFETRFLRKAQTPEGQQQIDNDLSNKLMRIGPEDQSGGKLHRVVAQAAELWAKRSQLRKTDVVYLAAALLYFISPLDAVPDIIPGIGYIDDAFVVSAVVGLVLRGLSRLGSHGKERLEGWIDEQTDVVIKRLDDSAASGIQNTIAAVTLGLWGATTAAAISLSMTAAMGGQPVVWLTYVFLSTALVAACNLWTAVYFWRTYRQLDGAWQERL